MYEFIRVQFELGKITAEKVKSYAPRYITTAQAEKIGKGDKQNG